MDQNDLADVDSQSEAGVDSDLDFDRRSYASDDFEFMDTNYFRGGMDTRNADRALERGSTSNPQMAMPSAGINAVISG